jgi:hypothetical protein
VVQDPCRLAADRARAQLKVIEKQILPGEACADLRDLIAESDDLKRERWIAQFAEPRVLAVWRSIMIAAQETEKQAIPAPPPSR